MPYLPEWKKELGKISLDWGTVLKWILKEIGYKGVDFSGSGGLPVASSCEQNNEPSGSISFMVYLTTLSVA
jgi:hypothetical protein